MPTIHVKGMSCQHCVASVTKALQAIDGITEVKVNLQTGEVVYEEERPVLPETVKQTIHKTGFEVV
jgi:copper chaperone